MDPDGSIASFSWNFGDGALSDNAKPAHAYTTLGTKTITLTVTDNEGASSTASGVANISDDSDVGSCAGIQNYIAGTHYSQRDRVVSDGLAYQQGAVRRAPVKQAWR
ncbi:MAG: chitinase [Arenicella sp.]